VNPNLVSTTEAVDKAFYMIFGISGVALLGVLLAMLWFVWRYNRKRCPQPLSQKDHNIWLEIIWTAIPTVLVMLMFWYGWEGYLSLRRIPDDAMHIKATARMWSWLFDYDNGKSADKLYVPVGQPVKVELIAEDVLHSFYVPAFRVKRDCVPGMPTYVWFTADQPGSYDLFCAEYCGVQHAAMITTVEALPAAEFAAWLETQPAVVSGKELLQKHGCLGCHSLDGSRRVGPSLQGIGGRQVTVVKEGRKITRSSDRHYLEESILEPNEELVDGYPAAMPSYAGRIPAEELTALLDYLEGLKAPAEAPQAAAPAPAPAEARPAQPAAPAEPAAVVPTRKEPEEVAPTPTSGSPLGNLAAIGEALAKQNGCLGCHSTDGSRRVGPSFKGLFGSQRSVLKEGEERTVTADAGYLAHAIKEPGEEVVKSYPAVMPPYPALSDADLGALIAWLESLK